jgi:hypothetical protein
MTRKRKGPGAAAHAEAGRQKKQRKRASADEAHKNFRAGLFDDKVRDEYTNYYAKSQPYVMSAFIL